MCNECEGRRDYLGTGIANLDAAKRYLRRKWNSGPLEPVVRRPGARFYVTARRGRQTAFLLGPYISHMTALTALTALTAVPRARRALREQYPHEAFLAVGTASTPNTLTTVFGR